MEFVIFSSRHTDRLTPVRTHTIITQENYEQFLMGSI